MRLPSAGWALLGLAVVLSSGYGLNRGVLVGSKIETARLSDDYPVPFYKKNIAAICSSTVSNRYGQAPNPLEKKRKKGLVLR